MRHRNLWSKPPSPGDLVEVGYDAGSAKPFIGVITELSETGEKVKSYGCVLVNGKPKWCNIYDLKPVKKKKEIGDE